MKSKWVNRKFPYDGSQLRSLFGYLEFKLLGDSVISWRGACNIPAQNILDGEDLLAGAEIRGSDMVHFIVEKFHEPISFGVAMQRIIASLVKDICQKLSKVKDVERMFRDGDDIYIGKKKFSISIATVSPVSTLVHFAVNVSNVGTPVETLCLNDLNLDPKEFAIEVMARLTREVQSIEDATKKVRTV